MWECKHDWWLEDFRFDIEQIWEFKLLLRKHPDDEYGDLFRSSIKSIEKHLNMLVKEYTKIYGGRPNLSKIRDEVEKYVKNNT